MRKKIWIFLLAIMILSTNFMSVYASNLNELKKEKNDLNQQIKNTKNEINKIESKTKDVAREIDELDQKMNKATTDLEGVKKELTNIEDKIVVTTAELEDAESNLENKKNTFNKRIRVMYMNGSVGFLEILLSSSNIKDFLSRQDIVESIAEHDKDLIQFIKEQRDTIDAKKVELEAQRASVEVTKSKLEARKKDLNKVTRDKEDLISRLKMDRKALEEEVDKLNDYAKKIEADIVKLQRNTNPYTGGKMGWPAPGYNRITSEFGYRIHPILKVKKLHTGIDIGVPTGGNIVAASDGIVIYSGALGGYGNTIMIDHGSGIVTLYAHNSSLIAKEGSNVKRGDLISKAGSTGMSTGPHLHFEVRKNGAYQDPLTWLK